MADEFQTIDLSKITVTTTTSNNVTTFNPILVNTGTTVTYDTVDLPSRFMLVDEEGNSILIRGEIEVLSMENNEDLLKLGFRSFHHPGYASTWDPSPKGYDSVPLETYDCGSLAELDVAEHNVRRMIELFEMPDVQDGDSFYGYNVAELRGQLEDLPRVRKEIQEEEASEAERANFCTGWLNQETGDIDHNRDCPKHPK